ncbi:MAG: pyridoxamine 5'-phosphate oxidase family protein [Streptococcaceae bacterium]|jgi:general stress protein 26|nr:pyridoxamine 5'-phosphate oxidase family protein [Streptococcaceae bacterium]
MNYLEERATAILESATTITLASVNEEGFPRPMAMIPILHDGIQTIYFETKEREGGQTKVNQFQANEKAGIEFHQGIDSVTIFGEIEVISSIEEVESIREKADRKYFASVSNDGVSVLKFTSVRALYVIDGQFKRQEF